MPRNSVDALWDYFKRNPNVQKKMAMCFCCGKHLSFKTTVTNLKIHLKTKHRKAFNEYMEKKATARALSEDRKQAGNDVTEPEHDIDEKCHFDSNDENSKDGISSPVEVPITDAVSKFFSKESRGRACCDLCGASVQLRLASLTDHMKEKHPKIDIEYDTEETQDNTYQEVVYLYDSDSKSQQESKPKRQPQTSTPKFTERERARLLQPRKRRHTSVPREEPTKVIEDEELNNFSKYITCLMKTVPKDLCTQLQMDIINLIMTAKLKHNVSKTRTLAQSNVVVENVPPTDTYNQSIIVTMANGTANEHNNMPIIDNNSADLIQ